MIYPVFFSHVFLTFLICLITHLNLHSLIKQLQLSHPVILSFISGFVLSLVSHNCGLWTKGWNNFSTKSFYEFTLIENVESQLILIKHQILFICHMSLTEKFLQMNLINPLLDLYQSCLQGMPYLCSEEYVHCFLFCQELAMSLVGKLSVDILNWSSTMPYLSDIQLSYGHLQSSAF